MTIPALQDWTYMFNLGTGTDEKGQVFGIPHNKFENIADSLAKPLPVAIRYAVYNNFIDFHAFCDVFARPMQDGAVCALIGYDSGESTLKMIMPLGVDKEIVTTGASEYMGDIFIDLATRWVRKVTLDEFVVTETRMPGPMPKMNAYTVRHILMRLISKEEFEKN